MNGIFTKMPPCWSVHACMHACVYVRSCVYIAGDWKSSLGIHSTQYGNAFPLNDIPQPFVGFFFVCFIFGMEQTWISTLPPWCLYEVGEYPLVLGWVMCELQLPSLSWKFLSRMRITHAPNKHSPALYTLAFSRRLWVNSMGQTSCIRLSRTSHPKPESLEEVGSLWLAWGDQPIPNSKVHKRKTDFWSTKLHRALANRLCLCNTKSS